ncbi:MAG: bifunctional (p)ppGpp synthetase/guanosine-3',5'-bis(diphosphate) 3'-pyrophosphohydrolase [Bacteroidetes bacterium]|nr:bifunctional (p)ppGpp synthetase/guanosine-3',5'-bis(diphosphate) 3'-pyrophosphohydrolase [Bacteroidota bacterium]
MEIQSIYQQAIKFAAAKHSENNQTVPGTMLPYVVHLSNVAMEILVASQHSADFNVAFAVQTALLHDTLEDTSATADEIAREFGSETAQAVQALTKNKNLPHEEQMKDCLRRIQLLPKEVGAVKLADRITNLQKPPGHWNTEKKEQYRNEAMLILQQLQGTNSYLEQRLGKKITEYEQYRNNAPSS